MTTMAKREIPVRTSLDQTLRLAKSALRHFRTLAAFQKCDIRLSRRVSSSVALTTRDFDPPQTPKCIQVSVSSTSCLCG